MYQKKLWPCGCLLSHKLFLPPLFTTWKICLICTQPQLQTAGIIFVFILVLSVNVFLALYETIFTGVRITDVKASPVIFVKVEYLWRWVHQTDRRQPAKEISTDVGGGGVMILTEDADMLVRACFGREIWSISKSGKYSVRQILLWSGWDKRRHLLTSGIPFLTSSFWLRSNQFHCPFQMIRLHWPHTTGNMLLRKTFSRHGGPFFSCNHKQKRHGECTSFWSLDSCTICMKRARNAAHCRGSENYNHRHLSLGSSDDSTSHIRIHVSLDVLSADSTQRFHRWRMSNQCQAECPSEGSDPHDLRDSYQLVKWQG